MQVITEERQAKKLLHNKAPLRVKSHLCNKIDLATVESNEEERKAVRESRTRSEIQ